MSTSPRTSRDRWLIPAALLCLYLVWGSTYLAIKWALEGFAPFPIAALRFLIAGGLMYGWLRWHGVAAPTAPQWRNLLVMGSLLLLGGNALVNYAEQHVSSGLAAVAIGATPCFAAVFGAMYGRRPGRNETIGLVIGFLGLVLLNLGGEFAANRLGAIALLISPMAWAFGSVWSRGRDLPGPAMSTAAQMLAAAPVLILASWLHGEDWVRPGLDLLSFGALMYLVVAGSILGFGAYVYLLDKTEPVVATSYAYVNPLVAVLLGVWLGGEHLQLHEWLSMGVILIGVVLITRRR